MSIIIYSAIFLILGIIAMCYYIKNQKKVAKFRDSLKVNQDVFILYRDIHKYYPATIRKVTDKRDLGDIMVLLEVHKDNKVDEIVWTSILNIYPYGC